MIAATATVEPVAARGRCELIVPAVSNQQVRSGTAQQRVVTIATSQDHIACVRGRVESIVARTANQLDDVNRFQLIGADAREFSVDQDQVAVV